jgi:Superinfection immunity protein
MTHTEIVRDRKSRPVQLWIAWIAALLTLTYMLPWAIAVTRGKSNAGAIGWLNLLLGWSLVGWVAALVMACTAHQVIGTQSKS